MHYRNFAINKVLESVMSRLYMANALFQKYEPWSLQKKEAECIIYLSMETIRVASLVLQPVIPHLASKALDRLGVSKEERMWRFINHPLDDDKTGKRLGDKTGLLLQRLTKK